MTGDRSPGISDVAMLAMIGIALTVASAVWVWGGVAGELFGEGWPGVSPGQLLPVIVRLPGRLADPAAAWPRGARRLLPGSEGFYAALGLLVAFGAALTTVASRTGLTAIFRRAPAGARWATGGELRALHGGAGSGRLALGPVPGPAVVRRGAPCAGGLRTAAIRKVGGAGRPGAAGMGRARRRLLHQDRPAFVHAGSAT